MAAALLFVSSPCPLVRTTCMHPRPTRSRIPPRGTEWGARRSAGSTSGTVHQPPKGRGTQSHGCGPLARQVLPTGRRLAGRSRGLGPCLGSPPSPGARHFCRRCPRAEPSSTSLRPHPRVPPNCNAACLWNAAALHPDTAALPVDCSNTAFRMWQHYLWTAAALLLDSDSSAFTMWHYCLQKLVPLPLECCMPLECCSTASQHCSTAGGLQQLCLWTAAALLLDSDTAFPMRQHRLQLVVALPSHGSGSAFTMWQHCLQTVVSLPLECCMPLECCSSASRHSSTTSGLQQHCLQNVAALPVDGSSTVVGQ